MDKSKTWIRGLVTDLIYSNEQNGYRIVTVEAEGEEGSEPEEITMVGTMPGLEAGETVEASGFWKTHPIYGDQFAVSDYERVMPKTEEQIERYLASGVIKGIGQALAHRIVEKFGETALDVIDREPERLAEIKGISKNKAMEIAEQFARQRMQRDAMMYMQQFGISVAMAVRIYKKYKEKTIDMLRSNPYRLAEDIHGIGFRKADEIAQSMGTSPYSPFRIRSAVLYVLQEATGDGHVYLPKDELEERVYSLTGAAGPLVDNAVTELFLEHKIFERGSLSEEKIFLYYYEAAEHETALRLIRLEDEAMDIDPVQFQDLVSEIEHEQGMVLSDEQARAVNDTAQHGVCVITGGPGTGKTTIISVLLSVLERMKLKVLLAAPTGRAAKRMTETTRHDASTIHRMLEMKYSEDGHATQHFERNEENPLEADVVIIDEMSMVDIQLMSSLLRGLQNGTHLILVGDADQLPSVGPGNVLSDIIDSGVIYVSRLTQIYRQAEASDIVMNAHRILGGDYPIFNQKGTDFFLMRRRTQEEIPDTLVDAILHRVPRFAGCNSMNDIQVLTPMKKGILGVESLNPLLQKALNPPAKSKTELEFRTVTYREGDKVMQIRNNYTLGWQVRNRYGAAIDEGEGVFNGDIGRIRTIDRQDQTVTVVFDESKEVTYEYPMLEELELAYCITIHKSQGSQSPVIMIPLFSGPDVLLTRNLLYTAITRASRYVIIIGSENKVRRMVDNARVAVRYTTLRERLVNAADRLRDDKDRTNQLPEEIIPDAPKAEELPQINIEDFA